MQQRQVNLVVVGAILVLLTITNNSNGTTTITGTITQTISPCTDQSACGYSSLNSYSNAGSSYCIPLGVGSEPTSAQACPAIANNTNPAYTNNANCGRTGCTGVLRYYHSGSTTANSVAFYGGGSTPGITINISAGGYPAYCDTK